MLEQMSKHARECLERAADCRRRAQEAGDAETQADWHEQEARWLKLAEQNDLSTRIANKRREVQEAEEELRSAGHRLSWLGEELGRLYEQQSSTASA